MHNALHAMQVGPIPAESSKERKKDSVPGHRATRRRVSLENPNSPHAPEGPFPFGGSSPGADSNTSTLFPLKMPTGQELGETDTKKRSHEGSQTDDDETECGRHREAKIRVFSCSPSRCDEGSGSAEGEEEEEEEDGDDEDASDPRDIDQDNRSTSPSTPSLGAPDSDSEEEEAAQSSPSSPSSHLPPASQARPSCRGLPLLPPPPALRPLPAPGNSIPSPSRLPFPPSSSSSSAHCLALRAPTAPPPSAGTSRKLGLGLVPPSCSGLVSSSSSPTSSLAPSSSSSSSSSSCPSPHFPPLPPQPFTGPQAQALAFSRPVAPGHQSGRAYRGYSPSGSGVYPRPLSSPSPSPLSSPSPSAPAAVPGHTGPQAYSHQASAFVFTPSSSSSSSSCSSAPSASSSSSSSSAHSSSPSVHTAHSTGPGAPGPTGGHPAYSHQASAFAFTPSSSPSVPSSAPSSSSSSSSAPTSTPSTHSAPSAPSTATVHPGPRLGPQAYTHQASAFGFNPSSSSSPSVPSAPSSSSPSAPSPRSGVPGHTGPQSYPQQASAFGFARSSSSSCSPGRGAEGGGAVAGARGPGEPAEGRDGAESPAERADRSPSPEPVVVDMASHASQSARFIRHFDRGLNCCSRTDLFFVPLPGSKLAKKREEVVERARREAEQRLREEKEREREREREKEVERALKASGEARMQEPIFPGPGAQRAPFEAPATGVAAVPPYLGPDVPALRPLNSQGVHPLMEPLVGSRITYPSPLLGPPVSEHDLLRQHLFGPPYRELPGSLAAPLSAAHQLQAMQAQSAELQRLALEHHQHWLQGVPLPGQEDYYRVWANYFSMRR